MNLIMEFKAFKSLLVTLIITALIASCGSGTAPDENLQQAFDIHENAMDLRNQIAHELKRLNSIRDSSFLSVYRNDLDSINGALKRWDDQLVEVPGFEESHDHTGHDHHHDDQQEMTTEQQLQVQQYLLQEIQKIEKTISSIEEQL